MYLLKYTFFKTFIIRLAYCFTAFLAIAMFTGCEKTIDFKLKEDKPKLVVEATIENDKPPYVILSRSLDYFTTISLELLSQSFVHNADVYISDGAATHKLKEYNVTLGGIYTAYYYSVDTLDAQAAFSGKLNHQYSLRIVTDNKEFTATTTIPNITKKIDSLWWKPAPANVDSSKVVVMVKATDKPGYGDYVRYFTKRNDEPFFPAINSVYDDLVIDGTTYELQVDPGVDRNAPRNEDEHYFIKGDTVTFKLSNIDKATYDFWRTMEYSYQSIGNPFSTPTKVLSNISNGALGYFGGYASQYHTIVIPL